MHVVVAAGAGHKGPAPGAVPHIALVVGRVVAVAVAAVEVPHKAALPGRLVGAERFPDIAQGIAPEINIK